MRMRSGGGLGGGGWGSLVLASGQSTPHPHTYSGKQGYKITIFQFVVFLVFINVTIICLVMRCDYNLDIGQYRGCLDCNKGRLDQEPKYHIWRILQHSSPRFFSRGALEHIDDEHFLKSIYILRFR